MSDIKKKYVSQLDDNQVFVTSGSINKTLDQAINDGDIGGGGVGDVDILQEISEFDASQGLTLEPSGVNGETFRLTHDGIATNYAEVTIPVTEKFRGKQLYLQLDINSTAESGNFKAIITDETNFTTLLDDQISKNETLVQKRVLFFQTDATTTSIKVRFEALPEAGSPTSDFDDAILQLALTEKRELSVIEQKVNTFTLNVQNDGTAVATGSSPGYQWWDSITRDSQGQVTIDYTSLGLTDIPSYSVTPEIQASRFSTVFSISSTSTTIRTYRSSDGALFDHNFSFSLTKQGSDYENLTRKVERELSTFHEIIQEQDEPTITKILSTDVNVNEDIAELSFDNLEIGEWYVLTGSIYMGIDNSSTALVEFFDEPGGAGNTIGRNLLSGDSSTVQASPSFIFQAKTSNLFTRGGSLGGNDRVMGASSRSETFIQLTKKSKLLKAGVVPDSKIEIPTSELRFEGASSLGTGAEAHTIKFDTIAKTRGGAFEIDNANGTLITVKKDGFVNLHATLRRDSTDPIVFYITKNDPDRTSPPPLSAVLGSEFLGDGSSVQSIGSASVSVFAKQGDVFRIASSSDIRPPTADFRNMLLVTHQEQKISVAISNIEPQFEDADSMVRVLGGNGHGSTNTAIRRFSNVIDNVGSDIQYTDSATEGAKFTVLKDGFYTISYMDSRSNNATNLGISLNSTELATNISDINDADVLDQTTTAELDFEGSSHWSGVLKKGDIIRPHTSGLADATTGANLAQFTIAKVGKPSIAEVDVTPFVNLEQSFTEHNSVNLAGNDGRVISVNSEDIQYSGWGIGWTSDGDNHYYTIQENDSVISLTTTYSFTTDAVRRPALYKNGVFYRRMNSQTVSNANFTYGSYTSTKGEFSKGDQLSIRETNTAGTLNSGVADNSHYLNILEQWEKAGRSKFHSVVQTENEFSARVNADGTLASKSADFIESIVKNGVGLYTVNFVADFFNATPSVVASTNGPFSTTQGTWVSIPSVSNSSVFFSVRDHTNAARDESFAFYVSNQGSDRKDLQRAIVQLNDFPRVNRTLHQKMNLSGTGDPAGQNLEPLIDEQSGSGNFFRINGANFEILKDGFLSLGIETTKSGNHVYAAILKNSTNVAQSTDRSQSGSAARTQAIFNQNVVKGDIFTFAAFADNDSFRIVSNFQGNELERITNVDKAENTYTVNIENNGTTASAAEGERSPDRQWWDSITRDSQGIVTIDFTSLELTEIPNIQALGSISNKVAARAALSTTTATIRTTDVGSNSVTDADFTFELTKQGSDYKSIQDVAIVATANHIQTGIERKTDDTFNGKPVYEYWGEVQSDITTTTTLDTIASGLNPVGHLNRSDTRWLIESFTNNGTATDIVVIDYNRSNGEIVAGISGAFKVGAGTSYKLRYTKP